MFLLSIRNVKFSKIRFFIMFITAVCFMFLINVNVIIELQIFHTLI